MSLQPCTSCGKKPRSKPHNLYVSWSSDNRRVSYRQIFCHSCAEQTAEVVRDWHMLANDEPDGEWPDNCSGCGTKLGEDFSPTYVTVFSPKMPQRDYVLATCEPCALNQRPILVRGAVLQADRRNGDVGAPTSPTGSPGPAGLAWT